MDPRDVPVHPTTYPNEHDVTFEPGMSLRDHFAGLAMQALIHVQVKTGQVQSCESAYQWAEAMLAARNA